MNRPLSMSLLVAWLAACGGGQARLALFSTDWEDDRGVSIARVWERVSSAPVPATADVVLGIAGRSDKTIGMPLTEGESSWTFSHPLDARPVVAGKLVVGSGAGEAFALDAMTGELLWRHPTGGATLLGAGDDGTITAASFRKAGATGSVLLALTHDGKVVQQIETERALGVPAVLGGMVFVPWAGQYVSVIDLANGHEAARVTLREQSSRAWIESGAMWFGEIGFIRLDSQIRNASRGQASTVTLPLRELPGAPKLMPSGNTPLAPAANAEDKTRLYARPEGTEGLVVLGDARWYATYFRLALGFEAGGTEPRATSGRKTAEVGGKLGWVYVHDADFVGGAAARGGVLLCDEHGKVVGLDAKTGAVVSLRDLGEPLRACVVNVDERRVTGPPRDAKPLVMQLAEAVLVDDPQLVVAQKLLLRELTAMGDEVATKTLVELASDPRTSPDLLAEARRALANRRNGTQFMEAALERHYDFLKDVLRPPPVGPIAQALGAMNAKEAAPLLALHLLDPADTEDDVMQAAAALAVVGGADQLAPLRQFFAMYRATADSDDLATAVVNAGEALLAIDAASTRKTVEAAAASPSTVEYARERLEAVLAALPQGAAPSPPEKTGQKK